MHSHRPSRNTVRVMQTAVLLVSVLAAVALPATAEAATPSPPPETASTPPSPGATPTSSQVPDGPARTTPDATPTPVPSPTTTPTPGPPVNPELTTAASAVPPPAASSATPVTPDEETATSAEPQPPPGPPSFGTVAMSVLPVGSQQTATGHNFTPGTAVRVILEPVGTDLGTRIADADGTVTTHFSTADLTVGTYTVTWHAAPDPALTTEPTHTPANTPPVTPGAQPKSSRITDDRTEPSLGVDHPEPGCAASRTLEPPQRCRPTSPLTR
jgi:hypothetical protein